MTDPQFTGSYHGRRKHASDLDDVVTRAKHRGVEKMLITGTSLKESREALHMAKQFSAILAPGCTCRTDPQVCIVQLGVTRHLRARLTSTPAGWTGTWRSWGRWLRRIEGKGAVSGLSRSARLGWVSRCLCAAYRALLSRCAGRNCGWFGTNGQTTIDCTSRRRRFSSSISRPSCSSPSGSGSPCSCIPGILKPT